MSQMHALVNPREDSNRQVVVPLIRIGLLAKRKLSLPKHSATTGPTYDVIISSTSINLFKIHVRLIRITIVTKESKLADWMSETELR